MTQRLCSYRGTSSVRRPSGRHRRTPASVRVDCRPDHRAELRYLPDHLGLGQDVEGAAGYF